jgi:hypothetical protein
MKGIVSGKPREIVYSIKKYSWENKSVIFETGCTSYFIILF